MEYAEAQEGLNIYKQHTLDNDRLGVRPMPANTGSSGETDGGGGGGGIILSS